MKHVIRRFTNVKKFADDTKYMECHPDGKVFRISRDGIKHQGFESCYSLDVCLQQIWSGAWVEIIKYNYYPRKSTFTDHFKDCFGFMVTP